MTSPIGRASEILAQPHDPAMLAAEKEAKFERELSLALARRCLEFYVKGEIRGLANLVRELEKHTDRLSPVERDRVIGHVVREANKVSQPPRPKGPKWDDWVTHAMVEDFVEFGHPKNPPTKDPRPPGDPKESAFSIVGRWKTPPRSGSRVMAVYNKVQRYMRTLAAK